MLDVPGPHFALSELLIVVAAITCGVRFGKAGLWLAATGSLLFGLIAAIGAFRFGMGQIDALAGIHGAFSQTGGAIAMSLIAAQLALHGVLDRRGLERWVYGTVLVGALAAIIVPVATLPLFLLWLAIAIGSAALIPVIGPFQRIGRALLVGIFLINILAVRQSPLLGAGLSWHLFHALVAVWLVCLQFAFSRAKNAG
ncbi:MAG: hypothetical protein ABJ205_00880 [Erythrobacter sp.]|uniref:hypothetical protein n=1 Tax=Erythrobacter sp. TaxID=1042 RepID=UPI003265949F